jgi:predicted transcriptional regulator
MVPLSEYAAVPKGSTLFDAVMALEKAQEEFDHTQYRHRAVLIMDKKNRVVGKLAQMDVLRALEPKDESLEEIESMGQFGFSEKIILQLKRKRLSKGVSMKDLCTQAVNLKVEDFMQTLSEGEYVDESTSIDVANQQLISGNHLALLVTRGKDIIGILRLSDVFAAVFHTMKECEIPK